MVLLLPQVLTFEEAQARRDRLARMRALLFYHELKAKRVKAIKSKEYHRRLNRAAKRKAAKAGEAGDDNEALRAAAEDAEFQRVKVLVLSDGPMRLYRHPSQRLCAASLRCTSAHTSASPAWMQWAIPPVHRAPLSMPSSTTQCLLVI